MRVTLRHVDKVTAHRRDVTTWKESYRKGLQEVVDEALATRPDVKPFTFAGYEGRPVFIHGSCGTIIDVDPAHAGIENSTFEQVRAGECDCENTGPWFRVYVGKQA